MDEGDLQLSVHDTSGEPETILNEIRIVLLGKIGGGKSALGNLLIGSKEFPEGFTQAAVTKEGIMKQRLFGQKTLKVVDTPGFFDPVVDPREIKGEIRKSLNLVDPGPHAFLVVLKADRLTPEERACAQKITEIIGPEALNWCILIITHSDYFSAHGTTFEDYYNSGDRFLPEVLIKQNFGGRYMIVNSKEADTSKNQRFINDMIQRVTSMIGKNNGMHFENDFIRRVPRTEPKQEIMGNIKIVEQDRIIPVATNSTVTNPEQNRLTRIEQNPVIPNILSDGRRNSSDTENQASGIDPAAAVNGDSTAGTSKRREKRNQKKKNTCTVL